MSDCRDITSVGDNSRSLDLPEGVPPLHTFYLYLSDSCNLACRHCWITPRFVHGRADPGDVIDVEHLNAAIGDALPLGLNSIKLTGGEPMLHPRFREIVDLISQKNLSLFMETNGTLLTLETARYLKKKTSMDFVSVSLDHADAGRHDSFRGVSGAFEAGLQGIDHLVAAGYKNVQVIMSVHRSNRNEVEDVVRLAVAHGAASVKFNPVTRCGRGAEMEKRGETLNFSDRMALDRFIFEDLDPRLKEENVKIDLVLNTPPALISISQMLRRECAMGDCGVLGILGILGSGEIALCGIGRSTPELVYGHLGEDSIRSLWLHHPTILTLRRILEDTDAYPGICGECQVAKYCRTGCVAQNYVDSEQLVWPDALCVEAEQLGLFPETRKKKRPMA
jgi:SynChlorMet cassette radical SAM/SPASM protein ScmF